MPASAFRLFNLALALPALFSIFAILLNISFLHLIIDKHFIILPSVWSSTPSGIKMLTAISVNIWLPAFLIVGIFISFSFHRKAIMSPPFRRHLSIASIWIVALFFEALALKYKGMNHGGLFMIGSVFLALPFVILVTIVGSSSVLKEIESFRQAPRIFDPFFPASILLWALPIPLFTLMLISLLSVLSWSPVSLSWKMNKDFHKLCEDTGVEYFARPSGKVRSVAYLSTLNQEVVDSKHAEIVLNQEGRLKRTLYEAYGDRFERELTLKLSEGESDLVRVEEVTLKLEEPFYGAPQSLTNTVDSGVDAVEADILVYYNIEQALYEARRLKWSGPKHYTIEISDRRSDELLGVMRYVIDRSNRRACGANLDNTIDEDYFVVTALTR
ncbi:hypothetical protein [Agarivorans sp. OAG1]|uniref:hypothetical protein n=1 Tax=Agarivorans sp. OAG1 TaxID=3082387 RepID=UPI0030D1B99D